MAAVPVPEQFGVVTVHRPEGVVELWFSKLSQKTALPGHGVVLGEELGEVLGDVVGDVLGEVLGDVLGEELGGGVGSPPHAAPLNVKLVGVALVPEKVAWNPKLAEPPVATDPL
jgi:hypothetical protein